MALVSVTLSKAAVTPTAMAAPTTSETAACGPGKFLQVVIGGTATTVTVVRPGTNPAGDAIADFVLTALTNTERWIPLNRDEFEDPATALASILFSQVTGVTARVVNVS